MSVGLRLHSRGHWWVGSFWQEAAAATCFLLPHKKAMSTRSLVGRPCSPVAGQPQTPIKEPQIQHWCGGQAETGQHITSLLRVSEPWNRLPTGVVEPPSLEILKNHLDIILCSRMTLLEQDTVTDNPCCPFQPELVAGQENLLAINTFWGGQGQPSCLRSCFPNTTSVFITHMRAPYVCLSTTGSVVLFNFQTLTFLEIWTISHIKKWSHSSNFIGQLAL